MFDLLVTVALLVLVPYLIAVYIYKYMKKVSTNDAAIKVKDWIVGEIRGLTYKQPLEYNPSQDRDMQDALLNAIEPYNALESKYVFMDWIKYMNTELPSIIMKFIPKDGEKEFGLIKSILKTLFYDELVFRGRPSPLVDVTITNNHDNYFIWIVYATTPTYRKQFYEYFYNIAIEAHKSAQKAVVPIIDSDLEKELAKINNNTGGKNE